MLSTEIPHPQKIEEAFQIIMTTTNQQIRKEADDFLRNLEQNYPYILVSLFQIFENSQVFVNRLQSLLLIKNVIVRNWVKSQIIEGKKVQNLSEELKNHVKEKIITYLGVIQDDKLKKEINIIVSTIAKHDFPLKFSALENYFIQGLQTIIQSGTIIGSLSYDLVVTFKAVEQNVTKIRLSVFKAQQIQFLFKVWEDLLNLWKSVTLLHQQEIQSNTTTNPLINKLSKKLDRLLAISIFSLHSESDKEKISVVFQTLLEKTAFFLKNVNQQKLLQPNIKTLVSSLGQIQLLFSLAVIHSLQDYFILLKLIIQQDWEDKRIIKAGLVGIYKILKTFFYYCSDQQFSEQFTSMKSQSQLQIKQQATLIFTQFFHENMGFLIELLIKIASVPQGLSDEELIEQEEDANIDDSRSEMDYPIYTLCLICEEQLMNRFPDLFIQQVQTLMQQLLATNFNANAQILESFFALLGQAPRVTQKLKIPSIQIQPVLQYLINANTIQSQRRFAFLCKNYCFCFSETELPQILEFQLALLKHTQDQIVQYQCLMCIKNVISLTGGNFDFSNISFFEQITPIIVKLLCNLQKSNILWPLLQLLEKLILRYSEFNQSTIQSLIVIIEKADLSKLMTTKNELLIGALCEMFQALFMSFRIGANLSHLYKLALTLIHSNLDSKENHIINLLLFLIQEYDPNSDNNVTGILLSNLYTQNEKVFLDDTDMHHMQVILKIQEELIILNLIPLNQTIYDALLDRMEIASQLDHYDLSQNIKRNCCSLLEAIIIKTFDNLDVRQYQKFIVMLVSDLIKMNVNDKLDKVFLNIYCLNHIVENLNRFMLKDITTVLQIANTLQITTDQFFILLQDSGQHIINRGNRKINVITTLLCFKYVQKNTFLQQFKNFLTESFPELNYYQELKNNEFRQKQKENKQKQFSNKQSRFPNEHKNSYKKELLLDLHLYDDNFNFIQFFFQQIQECMKIHGITDLQQVINEKDIIEKLNQLFNEQQQQQ